MAEASALQRAIEPAIEDAEEPEQLGLFGQPVTDAGQRQAQRRGVIGRPPGSRNKRTERTVAYLLARHRDPREVLLEIAESNVFDLAALLGCKPYEAMAEKRLAAIGVLPYLAARITPEVVDNRQIVHLTINAGAAELGAEGVAGSVSLGVIEAVEYQEVSADGSDA